LRWTSVIFTLKGALNRFIKCAN